MAVLRNMTLKHKLISTTMLTCVSALLVAGAAFITWEWLSLRRAMVRNLSTQAEMIADNCKAALAFEDVEDAKSTLQALHAEPSIVFGCVYTNGGEVFASYYRHDIDSSVQPLGIRQVGYGFGDGFLTVFKSIILEEEIIGMVCLRSDLEPMYAILKRNIGIIIGILVLVSLAAYVVSSQLQKIISRPILGLADVARTVSEKEDYSTRAAKQSNDEVGLLIDAFNQMLERIQQRDSALVGAKEQLETKVEERTTELSSTNVKLAEEIAERSSAQRKLQQHIKQLNCFYGLSKLIERPQVSLDQILQETAGLIRSAYRYPESTCVRITFEGIQYKTDNFKKSESSQHARMKIRGDKVGDIEVYYVGQGAEGVKEPFLKEEGDFLDALAEHLSRIAEGGQAREKLQLFRNLINQSNDSIFVIEPQWGRLLDANDKICNILGYSREELLDMTVKDIEQAIPDDSSWQEQVEELKLKADLVIQGRHKRKDGTTFFVETGLKLVSQREKDYIIAVARDITERKKAEEKQAELFKQAESSNRELKDFAHIVSHDLKAPLRGVTTLANWISADYADKLGKDSKEQMNLLLSRVDRMHNLIEGVLAYSRAGRIKEEKVQVNLNELVPGIIDTLAPPENIEITVEGQLPTIRCEQTRIMQVFQNLLSNAIKYMDKPQGRISVGCVEEDNFWKFSVADNGPGIEERHFERIFQIFQTLSPRDEFESTGVGLTVIKKIVELYDGRVWVESKPGEGSTFFFTLPKHQVGVKDAECKADTVS